MPEEFRTVHLRLSIDTAEALAEEAAIWSVSQTRMAEALLRFTLGLLDPLGETVMKGRKG